MPTVLLAPPDPPRQPAFPATLAEVLGALAGGRFRLLRLLGAGGMGEVYLAFDRLLGRRVALKFLPGMAGQDDKARGRLLREARAAARVRHPNVVGVHDLVLPGEGSPFVVMEYVRGPSLARVLARRGALGARVATRITVMACRALGAVHAAGLLHLDVKPGNLLLSAGRRVKLADFGVARQRDPGGPAGRRGISGSGPYLSPEQGEGRPLDPRSDLYSLGATYFHLLTGTPPYRARDFWGYVRRHRDEPVPDPRAVRPGVPAACAEVALRALAKDPRDRYRDARQMADALARVLESLGRGLASPRGGRRL